MPIPTETRGGSYRKGLASVRVRDDELIIKMDGEEDIYKVDYAPDFGNIEDGRYRVSMSSGGDKLFSIVPESGTYIVRYEGMVTKEGQLPSPVLIKGGPRKRKDGKGTWDAPDYLAFTVLLRIISVKNKKVHVPVQFNYSFEQYKDTTETIVLLGNVQYEKTAKFLQLAGLDFAKDSIPFSENILPWLDKTMEERNTKFQIELKNGYVDSMFPLAPELDED